MGPSDGICRSLAVMGCFRLSASSSRRACWRKCCSMSHHADGWDDGQLLRLLVEIARHYNPSLICGKIGKSLRQQFHNSWLAQLRVVEQLFLYRLDVLRHSGPLKGRT